MKITKITDYALILSSKKDSIMVFVVFILSGYFINLLFSYIAGETKPISWPKEMRKIVKERKALAMHARKKPAYNHYKRNK